MNTTPLLHFETTVEHLGPALKTAPSVVVAIPVKNEAQRITACLASLAEQIEIEFGDIAVLLLLNNTRDGTVEAVRELGALLPYALQMRSVELPEPYANAGWARRLGMEAAADWVAPGGLILTTDADTVMDIDWIAANRREIGKGVDAVAGYVMADPMELMELPPEILERGRLEWEYQQLAAELVARADPDPCDPWPRHNQNCGASAAITADAYRSIGGLPPLPVGEDRALFESLRRIDGKIRHSLDVQVVTSARTDGRALGGLSDAIRLRGEPDHPCDEMLEVAVVALRRALWRADLRRFWTEPRCDIDPAVWSERLRVPERVLPQALERRPFGEAWVELEAASPRLTRELVTGAGLKREIRRMRRFVEFARSNPMRPDAEARTPTLARPRKRIVAA